MLQANRKAAFDDAGGADDAELVARLALGDDRAALEELYRRHAGRLYVVGLRLLGDTGLSEELVQESFVRLWRYAGRFDPARGSVATFLVVLARRIAVDLWRRPSSRPMAPEGLTPTPSERWPPDQVETLLDAVVVHEALAALSPAHREVLELAYGTGLTRSEVARRLELPLGTVKTRSYYALRALKLALEERGIHG